MKKISIIALILLAIVAYIWNDTRMERNHDLTTIVTAAEKNQNLGIHGVEDTVDGVRFYIKSDYGISYAVEVSKRQDVPFPSSANIGNHNVRILQFPGINPGFETNLKTVAQLVRTWDPGQL